MKTKMRRGRMNRYAFQSVFVVSGFVIATSFNACSQNFGVSKKAMEDAGAVNNTTNSTNDGTPTDGSTPDGDGSGTPTPTPNPGPSFAKVIKTQVIDVLPPNNKLDILIVVDNSGSMAAEQTNMGQRMNTFLAQVSGLDWQLGIITTDMDEDASYKDGRLIPLVTPRNQNLPVDFDPYILKSSHDAADANAIFQNTVEVGTSGSGEEQGIASTFRAIQRATPNITGNASLPNKRLFRDGAALAVVLITDSDETFSGLDVDRHKPEGLIKLVNSAFGAAKTFTFHSIIVRPNDVACLPVNGNETYGLRYAKLTELTGGVLGNVCAADYGTQLTAMGEAVVQSIGSVNLECDPIDVDGDQQIIDDILVADVNLSPVGIKSLLGRRLEFNSALPVGKSMITYSCLELIK